MILPRDTSRSSADILALSGALILVGPLLAIAGGRWGTYIGIPGTPIFLADVAFILGLALLALGMNRRNRSSLLPTPTRAACLLILLLGLAGLSTATSLSVLTLRDAAPFFYLAAVPVYATACLNVTSQTAWKWASGASYLHLAWYTPAVSGVLPEIDVPFSEVPLFSTRGDLDGILCGIAVMAVLCSPRTPMLFRLLILGSAGFCILAQGSRAGLIGTLFIVAVTLVMAAPHRSRSVGPPLIAFAHLLGAAFLSFLLFSSSPPAWAQALLKLLPGDSQAARTGQNTLNDRLEAWRLVIEYTSSEAYSTIMGHGFGEQVVLNSNAVMFLSGDPNVRQAHNYLITWYGMVGLVGVAIVVLYIGTLLFHVALEVARRPEPAIALGFMCALALSGLVGVLLESPFGYSPFAAAAGFIFAFSADNEGVARPRHHASLSGPVPTRLDPQ